jgi:general secretion pathway protein G
MHRKPLSRRRDRRAAFTLFEILIVVALIALLATLAVTNVGNLFKGGQQDIAKMWVTQSVKTALMTYKIHLGDFPTTEEGLQALATAPASAGDRWRGPYVEVTAGGRTFLDPWGSPYQYRYPGSHNAGGYDLWSLGPDKKDGTADDIGNW